MAGNRSETHGGKAASADIIAAILADISAGEAGYKSCQKHGIPHNTFWRWIAEDDELADKYMRAKASGAERLADEIVQIADEVTTGKRITEKADGSTETVTLDQIERAKLRVDSRKWLLSKLLPRKYGDKLDLNHSGQMSVTITPQDEALG